MLPKSAFPVCEPLVAPGHDGGHRPEGLLHGWQGPEQKRHPDPQVPDITKWKDMEKIWRHSCNACEEQGLPNPKSSVEKMAQFTLQTFSTPAIYINHPGCAVPVATICTTGVAKNSSNSVTHRAHLERLPLALLHPASGPGWLRPDRLRHKDLTRHGYTSTPWLSRKLHKT